MRLFALPIQSIAVITEPITRIWACALPSLVYGYIATWRTSAVIVVNAVCGRFASFVHGIKRCHRRHVVSPLRCAGWPQIL